MFKQSAFLLLSLVSVSAFAGSPVGDLVGKYKIGACSLGSFQGLEKATIRIEGNKNRFLRVFAYSNDGYDDITLPLGSGSKATDSDGTRTWTTEVLIDRIKFSEKFERTGSNTWPDLSYETEVYFAINGRDLIISEFRKNSKNTDWERPDSCELQYIEASDATEIQGFKEKALTNTLLEDLADFDLKRPGDIDQAAFQVERAVLNIRRPSVVQLKEVLNTTFLPNFASHGDIKVDEITNAHDVRKVSKKALETVLEIANDAIREGGATRSDYAKIYSFQNAIEKTLTDRKPEVRAYLIEWSESDSDGEGILFIDTTTGEALYVGSAYFS